MITVPCNSVVLNAILPIHQNLLPIQKISMKVVHTSEQSDIFYDCFDDSTCLDGSTNAVSYGAGYATVDDIFDSGAWDPGFTSHPDTGEPVFTYRLYRDSTEIASASFYKHPLLCRSEDGTRHNIIATTGTLSNFNMDAHSIEEVCAALPPTMFDNVVSSAVQGAEHGAIRGISNVIGYTLRSHNVSSSIAKNIQQFVYCGGYFLLRYHDHYSRSPNSTWQNAVQAAYMAAFDTGSILLANVVISQLCHEAHRLSQQAAQQGWSKLGRTLWFFANYGSYSSYAISATQQGLTKIASGLVAGIATQKIVEQTGYTIVNRINNRR